MAILALGPLQPEEDTLYLGGFESNTMENSGFAKWIKMLLFVALVVVLIGGFAILGIGIWTYESAYGSRELSSIIGITLYQVDSYILTGCGASIIVITIFGFCGLFTQYKCILGLHLWLLAFLSVSLFVAGILGYVLIGDLENKVRGKMEDTVTTDYGINIKTSSRNKAITDSWDRIQQNFQCCGVFGGVNSSTSWAIYKEKSAWVKDGVANGSYVPESCCDKTKTKFMNECVGLVDVPNAPPRHGPPVDENPVSLNYTLYTVGCFDKLEGFLHGTGIIIGTTAIVIGVFLLIELVLSICMYRLLK